MNLHRTLTIILVFYCASLRAETFITLGEQKFLRVAPPTGARTPVRQYLPTGENPKNWNRSLTVQVFANKKDPMAFLSDIAARALMSKRQAQSNFSHDTKTGALTLDLTLGPASEAQNVGEWDLIRATYVEGRGLIVCSYVVLLRHYGKDTVSEVNAEREKWLKPFAAASFEEEDAPNQPTQPTRPTGG